VLGSFVVVYEAADDGIRVARVLHGARKLAAELERDAGDD
jgi:plasmid stabilization system protein ParE